MRYIDTGGRDPANSLGRWLDNNLLKSSSVAELRWQSGYFSREVIPYFTPALVKLRAHGGKVRLLAGSNDGVTKQADLAALLAAAGPPRAGLKVGVVFFANGYFHPKTVHIVRNDGSAAAYVGSANLTRAGVGLNVEAGIVLDSSHGDSPRVLKEVGAAIDWWFTRPRSGLHAISSTADLARLASAGVLDVPEPPRPRAPARRHALGGRGAVLRPLVTLPGPAASASPVRPSSSGVSAALLPRWTKKLSASDAQRKSTGNQRGSITLVQAGAPIDPKTYFRRVLFGGAAWVLRRTGTGQPLEVAKVQFDVTFLGRHLGIMNIEVSYAPNREAAQSNYTSLLHLGPLAPYFAARDMTGKQITIEQRTNGTFLTFA